MFMVEWLRINSLARISTFVIQPGTWRFFFHILHSLAHSFTCLFIHLLACLLAWSDFYRFSSVEIVHV